ncbi:MAG: protein-(glutamine-N5) methyltransferase, release factor-specific [Dehalococcoidia bacterium]|nr:protein-(glutamine-N5) methyltransferase, release factor-specific [Dehalococcoidia bacterium]
MENSAKVLLKWARDLLKSNAIEDITFESRVLLAHSMGISVEGTFLIDAPIIQEKANHYKSMVYRRAQGEPTAYIIGYKEFFGEIFKVDPRVLIPRPETELVVEKTAKYLNDQSIEKQEVMKIVDVGTGSGCIAISLAKLFPSIKLIATDISTESLELAKSNAQNHSVIDRVDFSENDLLGNLEGPFDIVVSNPPYIDSNSIQAVQREIRNHEPIIALDGGPSGTEILFRLITQAKERLSDDGLLVIEIGFGQKEEVLGFCKKNFPSNAEVKLEVDLAGIPRVLLVKNNE